MRPDMAGKFKEPSCGRRLYGKPRRVTKVTEDDSQAGATASLRLAHSKMNVFRDGGIGCDFTLLYRFLRSKVGQPWSEVYSEICSLIDSRKFRDHHFHTQLKYAVEQDCKFDEDGNVIDNRGVNITWRACYVHPVDGTLQYIERPAWKREKPGRKIFELDGQLFFKYDDIWYRVEMSEVSPGLSYDTPGEWVRDAFFRDVFIRNGLYSSYDRSLLARYDVSPNGKYWFCTKKESASSREIQKLKKKYNLE